MRPRLEVALGTFVEITFVLEIDVTIELLDRIAIKVAKGTHESFISSVKSGIVYAQCIIVFKTLFWLAFHALQFKFIRK